MKKFISYLMLVAFAFILFADIFYAKGIAEVQLCNGEVMKAFRIGGYVLIALKIIVPFLIIIFGMIDFTKAITMSDSDQIKKSTLSLVKRAIAGIIIFFLPTLVNTVFELVYKQSETNVSKYRACWNCVFDPGSCNVEK